MSIIDAMWYTPDQELFLTHGSKYYSDKEKIEKSFPGLFEGLEFSSIDAALVGLGSRAGKVYFFSGESYTRFDFAKGKCDEGYPRSIKDVWKIPFSTIDAAWSHPSIKNKYYMTNGSDYIRLTVDVNGFDGGFPQKLSRYWHGVDFHYIDAAIQGKKEKSEKMYFFSDDQYVRYDMKKGQVDQGYPLPTLKYWDIPDTWKPKTKHVKVRLLKIVCKETEDSGFFGAASEDEITVMWGCLFGKQKVIGDWRITGIDNGETKHCPVDKMILFEGELMEKSSIQLIVSLVERDHGGGADDYKKAIEETIALTAKAGTATNTLNSTAGGIITGIASAAKAIDLPSIAAKMAKKFDGDDVLGDAIIDEKVLTLSKGKKDYPLHYNYDGADYTVYIQIEVS